MFEMIHLKNLFVLALIYYIILFFNLLFRNNNYNYNGDKELKSYHIIY